MQSQSRVPGRAGATGNHGPEGSTPGSPGAELADSGGTTAMRSAIVLLLTPVLALAACEAPTEIEEALPPIYADTPVAPTALPAHAVIDRSLEPSYRRFVDEHAEEAAANDLVVFQLRAVASVEGAEVVRALKQRNPNLVVLGSIVTLSLVEHWNDDYHAPRMPLGPEMYALLRDRTARTTTGAIPNVSADAQTINPMRDGRLDTRFLDAYVDLLERHVRAHSDVIDGIYHDATSVAPWIYPSPELANIGEVDLDGDGVGFASDPDEAPAWLGWQIEVARQLQERLGPGFLQISNGRLALEHSEYRRIMAGVWLQDFPTLPWNYTPKRGFEILLDLLSENGVTPRRGRAWCLLAPASARLAGDVSTRRLASLITGQFYSVAQSNTETFVGTDPGRLDLGPPLAPMAQTRTEDGTWRLTRAFRDGTVHLEFSSDGRLVSAGTSSAP